jgi:hypothetical protein
MVVHAALSDPITWCDVICSRLSWHQTLQKGVFFCRARIISDPVHELCPLFNQAQKWVVFPRPWITVSCLWSFFRISNITATLSANSVKNLMMRSLRSFVRFISLLGTFKYSHKQCPVSVGSERLDKRTLSMLSASLVGFCRPDSRKTKLV